MPWTSLLRAAYARKGVHGNRASSAYGNRIYQGDTAYSGTPTHEYNEQNRLIVAANEVGGASVAAVYDAFGRRVYWQTMVFVYDQAGRILEVSNRAGNPWFGDLVWVEGELLGRVEDAVAVGTMAWVPPAMRPFLPPPGQVWLLALGTGGTLLLLTVALRTRSPRWGTAGAALALVVVIGIACTPTGLAFYWVVTDHLGTPIALANTPTSGPAKLVWKASYAPFGQATEELDPDGDGKNLRMPVRFPGQWWDYATNLHYNFFRTYDPTTGRYLEADPIGQAGGFNLYAYAANSPVDLDDPLGLQPFGPEAQISHPETSQIVFTPPSTEPADKWYAGVTCGQSGIQAWIPDALRSLDGLAECGVIDCFLRHEQIHIRDFRRVNPRPCKGAPRGWVPAWRSTLRARASEVRGYSAEIECLQNKLKACDKECVKLLENAREDAMEWRELYRSGELP